MLLTLSNRNTKNFIISIACCFFSVLIGGWVARELIFPSMRKQNATFLVAFKRLLSLVALSVLALAIHEIGFRVIDAYYDNEYSGYLSALMWLSYAFCLYKIFRHLFKKEWLVALEWIFPLTFLFYFAATSKYWFEKQYLEARIHFYLHEKYYTDAVERISAETSGAPKMAAFLWKYSREDRFLIAYDESDDLANPSSYHIQLFHICEPLPESFTTDPNGVHSVNQISAKHIKSHFYLVIEHLGIPVQKPEMINGKRVYSIIDIPNSECSATYLPGLQ